MSDWLDQVDGGSGGELTYPLTDDLMKYDKVRHRYVLTRYGVELVTGINLERQVNAAVGQTSNMADFYLRMVSDKIYNYVYSKADNKPLLEYVMAKSPTARQMLFDAMIAQTLFFITNGDISQFSGVNIKNGNVIDRRVIKENMISPDAEMTLLNTDIPELGGNTVLYQGYFYHAPIPTYEEGGF
jgi:hypothetical protein